MSKVKEQYEKLLNELLKHDYLYYIENKPTISDYEYDQLYKKLEALEKEHADLISPISPTQRVGEKPTQGFKQAVHKIPMLSLDNTYSKDEVEAFVKRVHKLLDMKKVAFCAELKMDGVAISVHFEKGRYDRGVTRGDGKRGDDVTANIKTIRAVPLQLSGSHIPHDLEVRGEVFMPHKAFQKLNKEKEEEGEELWANPRNAAAGSLKLLDPKITRERNLSAVFYGIVEGSPVHSQYEVHQYLKKIGLPSFDKDHYHLCHDVEDIMKFADKIQSIRSKMSFDIDGIVIKVDDLRLHDALGFKGKSPRFAVAYKFAPEQAETKINDIIVQVGRTGVITPVAELEPVLLAGSTISRATLHNQDEIDRKDIREGDHVIIEKGGDVIPKVVEVVHKKRPRDSRPWKMPRNCPSCGSHLVHQEGEVAVRCPNSHCPSQQLRRIIYFAGKDAMDIENLGVKVAEQLVEKGLVKSISDIYALNEKDLALLEGFKEKSIHNLLDSIEKSRHVTLGRFLMALSIRYVGTQIADLLADVAGDIETLAKMTKEELLEIEGIGDRIAEAIVEYFSDPIHMKEIHTLIKRGVKIESPKRVKHTGPFAGKTFVLTGTLSEFTRSEAAKLIKENGGKVTDSVTKKTDYLIVGEEPGSKLDRARELKVKILSEAEFKKLL